VVSSSKSGGRLGAGSPDREAAPVIFQGSRYAERLPIGLPDLKRAARASSRFIRSGIAPIRWRWWSSATSGRRG
jgi:hypothetical protein